MLDNKPQANSAAAGVEGGRGGPASFSAWLIKKTMLHRITMAMTAMSEISFVVPQGCTGSTSKCFLEMCPFLLTSSLR